MYVQKLFFCVSLSRGKKRKYECSHSHCTPIVLPWYSHPTPIVLPWYSHDTPKYFHGTPRYSRRTPVVLPSYSHGTPMILPNTSMVLPGTPRYFHCTSGSTEVDEVSLFPPCLIHFEIFRL